MVVALAALAALVRVTTAADRSAGTAAAPASFSGRPNLLVITTDDQTLAQFTSSAMPFMHRFLDRRGSIFPDAIAAPPLCCPSRAGFLTGQYPHNHGVFANHPGYPSLKGKRNTLPVWLDRAGYRTGLIGKYLNGYPVLGGPPAPGWDEWFAAGGSIDYSDFDVSLGSETRHYGGDHYSTAVYTHAARRFIHDSATDRRPFFAWLTYNAPHLVFDGVAPCAGSRAQPQTAADYTRFAGAPLPASPARAELDLSDKGRWIRGQAPTRRHELASVTKAWRCALASLRAVDRGFRSLIAELRRDGELERTIIVFTSDNGFYFGEHAITEGKELPYEPALRVPLAIAVPPALSGDTAPPAIGGLVSNVDLAPTLLDYAGARPCASAQRCRTIDGRSLRPLLAGRTPGWTDGRAIPIELDDDFAYEALRTPRALYMELRADRMGSITPPEIELYDLGADPEQLDNLRTSDRNAFAAWKRRLSARLHRVIRCSGTTGPEACP